MGPLLVIAAVMAVLGYFIGNSKGRATEGAILKGVLGLIGIIILLCLAPKREDEGGHYFPASAYLPVSQPTLPPTQPVSQWVTDPYGRHEYRWWDGRGWSNQVSDRGVQTVDSAEPLALHRSH